VVRRDDNLRRMHLEKKKTYQPVSIMGFFLPKTVNNSDVGFKDLPYFYKTKQNKTENSIILQPPNPEALGLL